MKKKITVAIADRSKEQAIQLASALQMTEKFMVVGLAHNGEYASRMVWEQLPDILVLDLHLPYGDGFSVIKNIQDMVKKPVIILTSTFLSSYVMKTAQCMGVQYLLQKPYSIPLLIKRMEDLTNSTLNDELLDPFVTNALIETGIPNNLPGYHYLHEAIKLVIRDKKSTANAVEYIYIPLAEKFDTKYKNIKQSIELAIHLGCEHTDIEAHKKYLIKTIAPEKGSSKRLKYPTNVQFISAIAEHIHTQLMVSLYAEPIKQNNATEEMIIAILDELGASQNLKGYNYFYDMILICVQSDINLEENIKALYFELGEKYETSPYNINQRIELVIKRLFLNGNQTMIREIYGYDVPTSKPKNASFIQILSKYIRMKLNKGKSTDP